MANTKKDKPVVKEFKKIPTPYQDRIVISKKEPEKQTAGGIIIPDTVITKENEGIVVATGPTVGKASEGRCIPQVGDRVLFGEYAGMELTYEGEKFLVVKEADVLCKI